MAGGDTSSVWIWDATTGERLATLSHEAPDTQTRYTIYRAMWSPDERSILTISGVDYCDPAGCDFQARVFAAP
jgi:hypothetical protein